MKKVIIVISEQIQSDAGGFLKEFEKLGGQINGIVCLVPKKNLFFYFKKSLRFIKKLKPQVLKNSFIALLASVFNKQTVNNAKSQLAAKMPSSRELLTVQFDFLKYAQMKNIPFIFSPSFTSTLVNQLTKNGPVIFPMYAGGIWSKELLAISNAELINAHMGEMPHYRGMNVIEWATLEGNQPKVAVMVMNEIIDGGDIILHKEINIKGIKSVFELRKAGFTACYGAMAEAIFKYQKGETQRTKQPKGAKYYYRMHTKIKEKLESKLAN